MAVVLRSDWAANVRNNCIDASAYAYRFQREPHAAYDLVEEIEPYFKKSERLTAEEISEIEKWPDTVSELFGRDESKGTKDHFLKCLRGVVDPETPTERICTKLIHQALAMGGLHCRMGEHEYAASQLPEVPPSNDVVNLKTRPLRSFLLGVQKDMSELVYRDWRIINDRERREEEDADYRQYEFEQDVGSIRYEDHDEWWGWRW